MPEYPRNKKNNTFTRLSSLYNPFKKFNELMFKNEFRLETYFMYLILLDLIFIELKPNT